MKRRIAAAVGLVGLVLLLVAAYFLTAPQDEVAEPVVTTTTTEPPPSPPVAEPSSLSVSRDNTTIRLEGTVQSVSDRESLVAAVTQSGFVPDDALAISPDIADSDAGTLAQLLPAVLDGTEDGAISLSNGTVTITGEALDPVEAEEIGEAIDAVAAAGLAVNDQTTVRVLPESVQIVALQDEINQIFELARTIEGQTPNFAVSLDGLEDGAKDTLDRVTIAMRRYPLPHADIIGHTDSSGSKASNQELSDQRAQVVLDYLTSGGIEANRLTAIGRGETEPIASNDDEEGRAENRRVDFTVKSSGS